MSVLEWLEWERKCSETVVGLDLILGLSTERRCSLNLSLRRLKDDVQILLDCLFWDFSGGYYIVLSRERLQSEKCRQTERKPRTVLLSYSLFTLGRNMFSLTYAVFTLGRNMFSLITNQKQSLRNVFTSGGALRES